MRFDQLPNEIARFVSGSATPATDILDSITDRALLQTANEYFSYAGGLHAQARAESSFVRSHNL